MCFVDKSAEWYQAIDSSCRRLGLDSELILSHKQNLILKTTRSKSQFISVADDVRRSIAELREFVGNNRKDYVASGRLSEQAKDEIEENVGLLVQTITRSLEALKNSIVAAQQQQEDGQAIINEHTAAHLHGAVLVLAELLTGVTSSFDKCRAVRYQQSLAKELQQHRSTSHAPAIHGLKQGKLSGQSLTNPGQVGLNGSHDDGGDKQQMQQFDTVTQHIIADLQAASQQAQNIEASMRHITTLNQMISTAVMQQAEQIEQLYNDAVSATEHITRGNTELKKTIQLNKSSRNWVMVLCIVAGLLLVFFDWFYS